MPKFRLDRTVSVSLIRPVSRLLNGHRQPRVPILMYHGIRDGLGRKHPYFETNTSPDVFNRHMQFLSENGYTTIDLNEALEAITVRKVDQHPVVITFDDGYRDFYTHGFPVLAEYGFKATVFVVSGLTGDQRICCDGKEYMTWQEVREVHACGIRIGSHTVSHPELYRMGPREVECEVQESKKTIEARLGESIRSFSYPYAFPEHDRRFREMLSDFLKVHGYENGVSTILGTASLNSDWFFLPRLPVNSYDDIPLFTAKLEGNYDWLHRPQYLYKAVRGFGSGS